MISFPSTTTIIKLFYLTVYIYYAVCQTVKPNIIFIMTDDQDLEINSMNVMTNVLNDIAAKGITFDNAFTSTPVCCLVI